MLLRAEMMSKYPHDLIRKPRYDAPSVPRNCVVEARAGALSRAQALTERAMRVQMGDKHMALSLFQNGFRTLRELYLARLVHYFNSRYKREAFVMREQALSSNDCTEIICTSCETIIKSILPQDWLNNGRPLNSHLLLAHADRCSKVCGTCGVSCNVLAMEGQSSFQIAQHIAHCKAYSDKLASYAEYFAATGTFEITLGNCTKHQFNRDTLHQFTRSWLGGSDKHSSTTKFELTRQRRDELEVIVPGALEYFSERRESDKKEKEEALALPSYKCAVCSAVRKPPSKKSVAMVCSEPSCGVNGKQRRLNPKNWIEVEEEELDRKPAAK